MSTIQRPERRERRRARGLSATTLKLGSVGAAAIVFLGSLHYASANLYNPAAPLQPPPTLAAAAPSPAPRAITTTQSSRRGVTQISPSLVTTTRTPITRTHTS